MKIGRLAGLLVISLLLSVPLLTLAQEDATPTSATNHPVVGFWVFNAPAGHAIFHADGTYTDANPYGFGVGLGIWRPTDERIAEVIVVFPDWDEQAPSSNPVTGTIWWNVEVDETGNVMTGTFSGEVAGQTTPPSPTRGTRLTFESMSQPA